MKVEQAAGLPCLEIKVDKAEIARLGLSLAAVQDMIGSAIGGREAGVVFEGDRRFEIVVRLPEACATTSRPEKSAGPLPRATAEPRGSAVRLSRSRALSSPKAPTRSAARTASGASS